MGTHGGRTCVRVIFKLYIYIYIINILLLLLIIITSLLYLFNILIQYTRMRSIII